jgi:hypothetical protein
VKRYALAILALLLSSIPALAQVTNPSIIVVSAAPSGACTANLPLELLAPAGVLYSCQSGTWGVLTPASNLTPAACLAATTVTTPCVVYQGSFTGLGASGTTGVQTLYTTSAPAGATFQFCPLVFIATAGSGGTVAVQATYTTPGGTSRSTSTIGPTANLTSTGLQFSTCIPLAVAANSTLSFAVLALSGTGTPTWETEPVVTRIH